MQNCCQITVLTFFNFLEKIWFFFIPYLNIQSDYFLKKLIHPKKLVSYINAALNPCFFLSSNKYNVKFSTFSYFFF